MGAPGLFGSTYLPSLNSAARRATRARRRRRGEPKRQPPPPIGATNYARGPARKSELERLWPVDRKPRAAQVSNEAGLRPLRRIQLTPAAPPRASARRLIAERTRNIRTHGEARVRAPLPPLNDRRPDRRRPFQNHDRT